LTKNARWTNSIARTAALLALLTFAALALSGPAAAATSCGKKVVDDWYADGRVDGTYPFHCYDDAIEILPRDVRDYSSAKEDIERALQARMRGEEPPPATSDPTPSGATGCRPRGRTSCAGTGRGRPSRRTAWSSTRPHPSSRSSTRSCDGATFPDRAQRASVRSARRRAVSRLDFAWLPQSVMLHHRRLPFFDVSTNRY